MKRIRWQLVEGRAWFSHVIGLRADCWSHIDVITPGGMLRGAQATKFKTDIGIIPAGYRDRPPFYDDWVRRMVLELDVSDEQYRRYWEFSDAQLGKGYDFRGLIPFFTEKFPIDRDWRDPSVWFCSEEVEENCEQAHVLPRLYEGANHVDPGDIAMRLNAAGARKVCDLRGIRAMAFDAYGN